jgi:parvulin-like peptidyl-prolyl isomerase
VQENVRPPGANGADATTQPAAALSATRPTTVGVSSGQYYAIGGVVGIVNGTPIDANKVIKMAEPVFAARAKELDERQFRALVLQEIKKQILELRDLQLEYAAAERKLEQKDKDLADLLTAQWRQKQITAAGGSEAVARQRAAARGEDFDELVQQQYRTWMARIYYEKEIMPHVQVSAGDIREYYERNRDREFSEPGAARFRLIKIDHAKHGGREGALKFITELRNRIVKAGESFTAIAHSANDDPRLLKSGGDLGTTIQKGAFAVAAVDQAVWNTDAGKVTDVIEAPSAFYIALVEEKTPPKVRSFDESVQTQIDTQLRNEQFRAARMKERERLVKDAVWRSDESMRNVAIEMAMQNYPRWAGK